MEEKSIDQYNDLSVRAYNALKRIGINTIEELKSFDPKIHKATNCGKKTIAEIYAFRRKYCYPDGEPEAKRTPSRAMNGRYKLFRNSHSKDTTYLFIDLMAGETLFALHEQRYEANKEIYDELLRRANGQSNPDDMITEE